MSKRTVFTTVTPLPATVTRETVLETLKSHAEMIDLNPLVTERHIIKPPANATPEEFHCVWYSITDKVPYVPGGSISGSVTYSGCFHDLPNGLQTHVYAPMGLNIKGKWTLGGSLPGEPIQPVEMGLGAPLQGLYLREDVDMKCNLMLTSFVKKTLKKSHARLVDRLMVKAQIIEGSAYNARLAENDRALRTASFINSQSSMSYSESNADSESTYEESVSGNQNGAPSPRYQTYNSSSMQSPPSTPGTALPYLEPKTYDPSLVPASLTIRGARSSTSSYDTQAKPQNSPRLVSWQNLNAASSSQGSDAAYAQMNSRQSYPQTHTAELSGERYTSAGNNPAFNSTYPTNAAPRPPPKEHAIHEMEG
ncbi:hypothetical protein PVAG01_05355 [Phlyctema vagabunda]|uniref:DUF7053 domain-containing protein n=1 Tax=Phlyctema vagabunda TaxID=108571 RepID=A0ABR4PK60_9HELO